VGTAPTHGTLGSITGTSCTPSGGGSTCTAQVTYTPAANYNGTDSFTFTTNDGSLTSPAATVSVTVTPVNDPPAANGQSVTASKNVAKTITLSGSDIDSASLTFSIVGSPTNGTLGSITGTSCTPVGLGSTCTAQVTYTSNAAYTGSDSFTFTTNDGNLTSTAATVSVTVVNDPPIAANDSAAVSKNSVSDVINVRANDTDPNGDSLTVTAVTAPVNGTSAVGGSGANVTYTPSAGYTGPDSFTYTVSDGSLTATATVTVTVANNPPAANGQSSTTPEDTAVTITLTGSDPNGDPLTFAVVTGPANGSLSAITPIDASSASVIYTPNPDYNGADGFTFKTNDGLLDSAPATVSLTVTPVNDPPVSNNQTVGTPASTPAVITLTATDIDSAALTFSIVGSPVLGTLSAITNTACTPSGAGSTCTAQVTYTPNTTFSGTDSFTFMVNDGALDSNVATVNMIIFTDADGDGIQDSIDTQTSVASNDFSEAVSNPSKPIPTAGTIDNRGDRTFSIADAPEPDGVAISVSTGSLAAQVTVNCNPQIVIAIQPGNSYQGVVTCGSASVRTIAGNANVSKIVDGKVAVSANVAAGNNAKFDLTPQGDVTLALSSTSSAAQISSAFNDAAATTLIGPGVTVTYTISSANGRISITATGGPAQVTIYGQTLPIPGNGAPQEFNLKVVSLGDIDASGRVDGFDLGQMALVFGSAQGDANWNPNADLNGDGVIDGKDLTVLGTYFGKKLN